jgi:hypothetical protein
MIANQFPLVAIGFDVGGKTITFGPTGQISDNPWIGVVFRLVVARISTSCSAIILLMSREMLQCVCLFSWHLSFILVRLVRSNSSFPDKMMGAGSMDRSRPSFSSG